MAQSCFVYGTLMYPEVLQALLDRQPRQSAALIRGFKRYCIQGQVFPGTIASTPDSQVIPTRLLATASNRQLQRRRHPLPPAHRTPSALHRQVQGLVLFDLTPEELEVFDEFEGDEYTKVNVAPELLPQGSACGGTQQALEPCSVYLWRDERLLHGEWDAEAFREKHLPAYVEMCRRFATELREQRRPESRPFNFQ